jgi:hypothetical protein
VEAVLFNGNADDLIYRTLTPNPNQRIHFPAYNIGMQRELWGLTFIAVVEFVSTVVALKRKCGELLLNIDEQFCERMKSHIGKVIIEEGSGTVTTVKD